MLRVRHSGKSWLYYDALHLETEQDLALPSKMYPVGPGIFGGDTWNPSVRKLVLNGFRFDVAPERPDYKHLRPRRRDTSGMNASFTFGPWGGERSVKLDELNHALGKDAYFPLQQNNVVGGFDFDFTFGRVRVGMSFGAGGRTTHQRRTERALSTWMSEIFFTAGFDVLRFEQLHVFVGSGIGSSQLYVDRPYGSRLFPDARQDVDGVRSLAFEVPLELGTY